jgi:lysophospholipase L1-like esterase
MQRDRKRAGTALLVWTLALVVPAVSLSQEKQAKYKYAFGPGNLDADYTQVLPNMTYTKERGFGLDLNSKAADYKPFFFSIALTEGNYDVKLTLGDAKGESDTRVLAESRRLMLENVKTQAGKFETRTITVNIRNSKLAGGGQVRLKDREINGPLSSPVLHWDNKLTLEFAGRRPCVAAVEIVKNDQAVTVYLAGDSTVTDQTRGEFRGWGQMLPRFFKPGNVAVSNHAESGEATTSFIGAKRLEKILSTLKKGDYLFIQFGHNDQNQKRPIAAYKDALKRYIAEARKRDAIPVLLTPMQRRNFGPDGKVRNSLGDYPEAVRDVAQAERVMLIDLHAMSKEFYESLGEAKSKSAFVDNTHTNEYGGYQFARYIAEAVQKSDLPLAKYVIDDLPKKNFIGK